MIFLAIILSLFLFDGVWWVWADRRLRTHECARAFRWLLAGFMVFEVLGYLWIGLYRFLPGRVPMELPKPLLVSIYIWHLCVVPITLLLIIARRWSGDVVRLSRWALSKQAAAIEPAAQTLSSRRQFLSAAAVAAPPLVAAVSSGFATAQLTHFRVNRVSLPIPNLPAELEGLSIVHLADSHIGRFTTPDKLGAIVEQANALRPDLVLMTGDLIDFSLDDLPAGIEMMHAFRSRLGTFMCEGNHDLFQDRKYFEREVRRSGLRLLLNESAMVHHQGQAIQLLGIKWGGLPDRKDNGFEVHTRTVAALRKPEAFPILLAHHPHAFDPARQVGIPLTLGGHSHGGQINLTHEIGLGPMMYKYWSGLYRKGECATFISNGVGNWFPLRINTPAEIVQLTLVKG
jgi:predicted MPP superfamily phosphohydrolase